MPWNRIWGIDTYPSRILQYPYLRILKHSWQTNLEHNLYIWGLLGIYTSKP